MGKPTGFLEFSRKMNGTVEPLERIKSFEEFHPPLNFKERQQQAARCMDCGVPFCQSGANFGGMFSGCPLHNLIPEWNDEIYNGNWQEALSRLTKTNNFPEFTGRVCPALCEAACTCGMLGESVTVNNNELAVIGFPAGLGCAQSSRRPQRQAGGCGRLRPLRSGGCGSAEPQGPQRYGF